MSLKLKRILAYFIDYTFIVLFVSLLAQIRFLNPTYSKYYEANEKYLQLVQNVEPSDIENFLGNDEIKQVNYDIAKYGVSISLCSVIAILLYYGGFQYWNKGQTLGKKIFKIKVVSHDNKKIKLWQVILRSVILYNVLFNLLIIISVIIFNVDNYLIVNNILSSLSYFVFIVDICFLFFSKNNLALHDIISKTFVVEESYGYRES